MVDTTEMNVEEKFRRGFEATPQELSRQDKAEGTPESPSRARRLGPSMRPPSPAQGQIRIQGVVMQRPTLRQRFRYWFDNIMSRGTGALLGLLALAVAVIIVIDALVVVLLDIGPGGEDHQSVAELLWQNLIRMLGADDVADGSEWAFRIAMLGVTIAGVFLVANLIGIISGAFDERVAELRKGRSAVLESGHTVIVGWNSKILSMLDELCEANASAKKPLIVVLANRDKVEMEDEIRDKVTNNGRTRIICRSGDPLDQDDLLRAAPFSAKSIIILGTDEEDSDANSIKTALAITRHPHRASAPVHLVGQIRNPANIEAARLAGGDEASWILGAEKVGQITAQTCRQPGLSSVYVELLNFGGVEIYFTSQPSLYGKTYYETQLSFEATTVIGLSSGGQVRLNPPADTVYAQGDQLVVITEDDSTIRVTEPGAPQASALPKGKKAAAKPEKVLVLGSNSSLKHVLSEFDAYAGKGSAVTVVSEFPVVDLGTFRNTKVTVTTGNTTSRSTLDALKPTSFDHVIVMAYRDNLSVPQADTKTLVTLLHIRDMMSKGKVRINVVSEMLDERTRKLAEVTQIDDFIVSDHLVSLMMAQVSENPQLTAVFQDLFDAAGSEIYLSPADWYVSTSADADFYTVIGGARARGETALGYMTAPTVESPSQVVVSPSKGEARRYSSADRIIVLSAG